MLNSRGKVGNEKHTVFRHSHNFKAPGRALQKFFHLTPQFFFAPSLYPTYISRSHLGPSLLSHVLIILFLHLSLSQVLPRSVWIDSLFLFAQGLLNHPHPVKYQYFSILCWLSFVPQSPVSAFLCSERLIPVDHITQAPLPFGFYLI